MGAIADILDLMQNAKEETINCCKNCEQEQFDAESQKCKECEVWKRTFGLYKKQEEK